MPIYVEGRMAYVLKEVAVRGGSWLANLAGADIVRVFDGAVDEWRGRADEFMYGTPQQVRSAS